jgi:hypothetical protein
MRAAQFRRAPTKEQLQAFTCISYLAQIQAFSRTLAILANFLQYSAVALNA